MPRITRAAKTLVTQIQDRWEDAVITNADDPDGLGVHRQLHIEEPVAEKVHALLEPIAPHDRRITGLDLDDDGLTITFASDRYADLADPFPLHEVEQVQKGDETDEVATSGPDSPKVDEDTQAEINARNQAEDEKILADGGTLDAPEPAKAPAKKSAAKK